MARIANVKIDKAFVESNPNLYRFEFADEALYDTYDELRDKMVGELAQRFVSHLNENDGETQATYKKHRKLWGNKHAAKGRDMWGPVQDTVYCGGGIKFVSCSGHGGFLISAAREAGIGEELRRHGVYEEDCDFNIVAAYYPEAATKYNPQFFTDRNMAREYAANKVALWNYAEVKSLLGE